MSSVVELGPAPTSRRTVRVTFQPMALTFDVPEGDTLFEFAAQVGVEIDTVCGGNGTCGKCRVRLDDPPPIKSIDHVHLTGAETADGWRLACQIEATRDLVVHVPPAGTRTTVRILHEGLRRDVPLQPNIRKIFVPYEPPRARDGVADWDAVKRRLPRTFGAMEIPLPWLRRLPKLVRAEEGMTLVISGRRVIRLDPGDTTASAYGVAIDLGSTTIVGFLMDLNTGSELAVESALNRQSAYGDDLVARLARAQNDPAGLERLHRMIVEQLHDLLARLASVAGIEVGQIEEIVVVGNMTMHHFLLGLDSTWLGLSPYAPVIRDRVIVEAGSLGLAVRPDTPVYVLPNIAGFVGSDTVAVALAAEMHTSDRIRLVADVGTNTEILLGSRRRLMACSAPAGPAFEGARITQGMRAAPGAIDHVWIDDDVRFTVIGAEAPRGICGSALIDITAGLLRAGLLDPSGRLLLPEELPPSVPDALRARLRTGDSRRDSAFVLVRAGEEGAEREIVFTQQDVREFQLAKGAIRAGGMVLQSAMGLSDDDLDEVLLAGAFGTYIDLENARRVNLVPQVPLERLRSIGNAAGVGARLALISTKERAGAERIARGTEHVRLSGLEEFQRAFIRAMRFPDR